MKRRFFSVLLTLLIFTASNVSGYDLGDLGSEADSVLAVQNGIVKRSIGSTIAFQKSLPVFSSKSTTLFSLDLSFAAVMTPIFLYNSGLGSFKLFEAFGENDYVKGVKGISNSITGQTIYLPNIGFTGTFPPGLIGTVNLSYLPEVTIGGTTMGMVKFNGNIYYRVLYEKIFNTIGAFLGGGYTYYSGSISQSTGALSYTDSVDGGTTTFNGAVKASYSYHSANAELFIHKSLLILDFFGRFSTYWSWGGVNSTLTGDTSLSTAAVSYALSDNELVINCVLSAGLEIGVGGYNLIAEVGKDLFSGSLYASLGLRIGM